MDTHCQPGTRATCEKYGGCPGPSYLCAPKRNGACRKMNCAANGGSCRYTQSIECSADPTPLCLRQNLK